MLCCTLPSTWTFHLFVFIFDFYSSCISSLLPYANDLNLHRPLVFAHFHVYFIQAPSRMNVIAVETHPNWLRVGRWVNIPGIAYYVLNANTIRLTAWGQTPDNGMKQHKINKLAKMLLKNDVKTSPSLKKRVWVMRRDDEREQGKKNI